jgi:hypothetical protein
MDEPQSVMMWRLWQILAHHSSPTVQCVSERSAPRLSRWYGARLGRSDVPYLLDVPPPVSVSICAADDVVT